MHVNKFSGHLEPDDDDFNVSPGVALFIIVVMILVIVLGIVL